MSTSVRPAAGRGAWPRLVAAAIAIVALAGAVVTHVLSAAAGVLWLDQGPVGSTLMWLGFAWFAVLGAVIVSRRPRNPMGWLLAAIGLMIGVFPVGSAYVELVLSRGEEPTPLQAMAAWPNLWYWWVLLGIMLVFIPLLFPNGTLLTRRWRPVAWTGGITLGALCVLGAFSETIEVQQTRQQVPNPIGITGLASVEEHTVGSALFLVTIAAILGAAASMVVRFRRSRGTERQQLKWFALIVVLIPPTLLFGELVHRIGLDLLSDVGFGLLFNALPLTIGLAILRYRLYDIDRIISRTVAYALIVGVLVATYAGLVVALQQLTRPLTGGTDLAVAASTLTVAAAFRPLTRRVRSVVDRRFNRARYDAQQTIDAFASRLRDEIDLAELKTDLERVVRDTMQPTHVTVWLPTKGDAR